MNLSMIASEPECKPNVDNSHENNFDLVRLFAAFQVLIFHAFSRFSEELPNWLIPLEMFHGVPIFFVISGFLVSASFERDTQTLSYARKRALRIFPGLYTCLAITALIVSLSGFQMATFSDWIWLPAQLLTLIYTPPFLDEFGSGSYNGSLWTIPIELQFYLSIPLLYYACERFGFTGSPVRRVRFFAICFVFSMTLAVLIAGLLPNLGERNEAPIEKLVRYSFLPHVFLFLFGILVRISGLHQSFVLKGKALYWILAYCLLGFLVKGDHIWNVFMSVLLGVASISAAFTLPSLSRRLLGGSDISYGVYIYHGLLINIVIEFAESYSFLLKFFIVLFTTIIFSYFSWILVEKPFLRMKIIRKPMVR